MEFFIFLIFSMRDHLKILSAGILAAVVVGLLPTAFAQTATQTANPFPDVTTDSVNADAISYLKDKGVLQGYPDGSYRPSTEINRAEFTKIIVGSLVQNPKGSNCFPDVKTEWYAPYVCEAKTRGIIGGYPDGTFQPGATINFSEASKIIANAMAGGVVYDSAPDLNDAHWFQPYVETLAFH